MKETNYQIKIRVVEMWWGGFLALPVCYNSRRFCQLMKRNYFTQEDVVLITKLGFTVINMKE